MKNKENSLFNQFTHSIFFKVLVVKFDAITVSLVSIAYGLTLINNPNLLDLSDTYELLSQMFTSEFFGYSFVLLGTMKLLSILINSKWLKIISISFLVGIWILFGSSLYQTDTVNTVYIHCFGWALISFGVVVREWVD